MHKLRASTMLLYIRDWRFWWGGWGSWKGRCPGTNFPMDTEEWLYSDLMLTSSYNIFLFSTDFIHFEIRKIRSFILSLPECKLTSCTVWWVLYSSSLRRRCWNFSLCFAIQISYKYMKCVLI